MCLLTAYDLNISKLYTQGTNDEQMMNKRCMLKLPVRIPVYKQPRNILCKQLY